MCRSGLTQPIRWQLKATMNKIVEVFFGGYATERYDFNRPPSLVWHLIERDNRHGGFNSKNRQWRGAGHGVFVECLLPLAKRHLAMVSLSVPEASPHLAGDSLVALL